jgi:hypothetical protein
MKFILSLTVFVFLKKILLQADELHFRCFMASVIALALLCRFPLILSFYSFLSTGILACAFAWFISFCFLSRIFASSAKVLVAWAIFLSTS